METLSLSANVFAVVGLADTVFRRGKDLYGSLAKMRRAPDEIKQFQSEIQELESVIISVRIFADEYKDSPLARADTHIWPHIELILNRCEREIKLIQTAIDAASGNMEIGWLNRWGRQFKWVLGEEKLVEACRQLKKQRIALNTALSLAGR